MSLSLSFCDFIWIFNKYLKTLVKFDFVWEKGGEALGGGAKCKGFDLVRN
jgi:hypothetical protein